ncbi:UNVERIFIED_CONTAM: histone H3-lysine(4) N-trimethyltransferase ATX1 [Sesamum angustifolium]|uniref:Histone H3-lysine(4) N-trimethyltransferase ATX1 n=1 Tax=Sesamum angustifolium TaxID=2727405 RepID=A0AAW2LVD5_9LAMI
MAAAAAFHSSADLSLSSDENDGVKLNPALEEREEDEFQRGNAPLKYIPLCDVYSATSPCVTATGSKKVKAAARKPPQISSHDQLKKRIAVTAQLPQVYLRRRKREGDKSSFFGSLRVPGSDVKTEELEVDGGGVESGIKRRRVENRTELMKLGVECKASSNLDDQRQMSDGFKKINCNNIRKNRNFKSILNNGESRKRKNDCLEDDLKNSEAVRSKKWVWLSFKGVDPKKFVGLQCKVYWPLDATWYSGCIVGYNSETGRHRVKYEDEEEENLILSNERIKFHISFEEMQSLKLKVREKSSEADGIDVNELMVLAASLDDCQETETGDIIWAKLTGHAAWPAIVLDESHVGERKGLNKVSGEKSVLVQFFGTHDFARVTRKQVISFLKGLLSSCHSKCKKPAFVRGLEEAKMYLSEQRLPRRMLQLRDGVDAGVNGSGSGEHEDGADSGDEECTSQDEISKKLEDLKSCPLEDGELQIGLQCAVVGCWCSLVLSTFWYLMEVLRDVDSKAKPLFRFTAHDGEEPMNSKPVVHFQMRLVILLLKRDLLLELDIL